MSMPNSNPGGRVITFAEAVKDIKNKFDPKDGKYLLYRGYECYEL